MGHRQPILLYILNVHAQNANEIFTLALQILHLIKVQNLDRQFWWRHDTKTLPTLLCLLWRHYSDVIMGEIASQITSLTIVYLTVYSGVDQRKEQSSASLAFVRGIQRCPANSPHKWPVTRKLFPFDDVITTSVVDSPDHVFPVVSLKKLLSK